MSEPRHGFLTIVHGIHSPHQWEYANAAARTGASGFVSTDLKKLALQTDDFSVWILTAATPTWVRVSSADVVWGGITGTLANQTDLANALDAKQIINHDHSGANQSPQLAWSVLTAPTANKTIDFANYTATQQLGASGHFRFGDGASNYCDFGANGAETFSGLGKPKRRIFLSASAGTPRSSSGCNIAEQRETTTNKVN